MNKIRTGTIMLQASLHEKYDDKRLMIRRKHSENSRQHLVAGLKGNNSQAESIEWFIEDQAFSLSFGEQSPAPGGRAQR